MGGLILIFVLVAWPTSIIAPPIIGFVLLARKRPGAGAVVLTAYCVLIISIFVYGKMDNRSTPGRIARWWLGAGLAKQEVEDQVEDLKRSPSVDKMQAWAIDCIGRFRAGKLATDGKASYWSLGEVKLSASEVPQFVSAQWKDLEPPEISVGYSNSGQPAFIVAAWYGKGVAFGDTKFILPLGDPSYKQLVIPGVYAYYLYK